MTMTTAQPTLPPRGADVLGDLPESFGPSQIDSMPGSICWFADTWWASTDAWADRRLGRLDPQAGVWRQVSAPAGWIRQPASDGDALHVFVHERNEDQGRLLSLGPDGWSCLAEAVDGGSITDWQGGRFAQRDGHGHAAGLTASGEPIRVGGAEDNPRIVVGTGRADIPFPAGATVAHLAPSPDRSMLVAVFRRGSAYQTGVFSMQSGKPVGNASFRQPVHARPTWLGPDRIVLVTERWPSLVPVIWRWASNQVEDVWSSRLIGAVRSLAVSPAGICVAGLSTPCVPRDVHALDDLDSETLLRADREIRAVALRRDEQLIPCLVYEPTKALRGTVFYFPGGPHEPMWGEYSAFSHAMSDDGWRVVRPNLRSSGLREERFRPRRPVRYGHDDVLDALTVIDELGTGPVVTMGMSYGGYIATQAGERSGRCVASAVLSGFLSQRDLDASRHPDVRDFARGAFRAGPAEASRLSKPLFVAHGSADPRVPIDGVRAHANRAESSFTFVELPGQGHAILSDHDARATYPRLLTWLRDAVRH
jgi:pimeloyl-ACP methyl ester carboxylesterase